MVQRHDRSKFAGEPRVRPESGSAGGLATTPGAQIFLFLVRVIVVCTIVAAVVLLIGRYPG